MGQDQSGEDIIDSCFSSYGKQNKIIRSTLPASNKANISKQKANKNKLSIQKNTQSLGSKHTKAMTMDLSLDRTYQEDDVNCTIKDKEKTIQTCDSGNAIQSSQYAPPIVEHEPERTSIDSGLLGISSVISIDRKVGEVISAYQRIKEPTLGLHSKQSVYKSINLTANLAKATQNRKKKLQFMHRVQRVKQKIQKKEAEIQTPRDLKYSSNKVNSKSANYIRNPILTRKLMRQLELINSFDEDSLHSITEIQGDDSTIKSVSKGGYTQKTNKNSFMIRGKKDKNGKLYAC